MPAFGARSGLDRLADMQDGVLTRAQLRDHGFDCDAVRNQIKAGRWQQLGRHVVLLHNGPLTEKQRRWAAVLAQNSGALAGVSAAHEQGLQGFDDETVHVVIAHNTRPRRLPGVAIHLSRHLTDADLHGGRTMPMIRLERALIDAASWTPNPRRACGMLAAAVQQRLTTAERLRAELLARPPARHHALLLRVLDDIAGGAHSFAEVDLGGLARRAGLPPPVRQIFRLDRGGRRRWLDADFGRFFVEIDGALHLQPPTYWDDMQRQNDLLIVTGKPTLRFATIAMYLEPHQVIAQLAAAGRRFGLC